MWTMFQTRFFGGKGEYRPVAGAVALNADDAYGAFNCWDDRVRWQLPCRSASIGDIFVSPEGEALKVIFNGFQRVDSIEGVEFGAQLAESQS